MVKILLVFAVFVKEKHLGKTCLFLCKITKKNRPTEVGLFCMYGIKLPG